MNKGRQTYSVDELWRRSGTATRTHLTFPRTVADLESIVKRLDVFLFFFPLALHVELGLPLVRGVVVRHRETFGRSRPFIWCMLAPPGVPKFLGDSWVQRRTSL